MLIIIFINNFLWNFFLCALIDYLRLLIINLFKISEFSIFIENIIEFFNKIIIIIGLAIQN